MGGPKWLKVKRHAGEDRRAHAKRLSKAREEGQLALTGDNNCGVGDLRCVIYILVW